MAVNHPKRRNEGGQGLMERLRSLLRLAFAASFVPSLLLLASPSHARPMVAAPAADCVAPILKAEKDLGIPAGLLLAVALVESGGGGTPQPHVLNVGGRVLFARSEADALRYLRDPQGKIRAKVMAGCMQLSLTHHRQAFTPIEKIVNPEANVRYAARLLVRLKRDTGSWAGALARYNGGTRKTARVYHCKVQQRLTELGASERVSEDKTCPRFASAPITRETRRAFELALNEAVS
jgi:hypothetical protein